MALGIDTTTKEGDFRPRIQYDAKAGRMFQIERIQDASGNWTSQAHELRLPLRIVVDFQNIEVGWIKLDGGVDFKMAKVGEPVVPQPADAKYKQGLRAIVYNKAIGVRHFSSTAKSAIRPFDELHDAWAAGVGANPGKVAVVEISSTAPVTTGEGAKKSTNYQPIAQIAEWIDRPAALDEATSAQAAPAAASSPAPAAAAPAPAGAAAAAPPAVAAPAPTAGNEF